MLQAIALTVAVLMGQSTGTNEPIDYRETASVYARQTIYTTDDAGGFHAWASGDYGQGYLLGQSVSDYFTGSVGLGYGYSLTDKLELRVEAGVGYPLARNNHEIQQEVAYTYLVGRHESEWRPVPVTVERPYGQDTYATTLHYDYGAVIRLGAEFEVTDNLSVLVNFKYFHPKTLIEIYDQEAKDNGGGWWQEYRSTDMSTIQVGLGWRF